MARAGRVGTARGSRGSPCPLQWLPSFLAPVFFHLFRPHLFFYSLNSQKILCLGFSAELLTVLTHFYCFGFQNVSPAFSRCSSQLFMEILPKPARWFAQSPPSGDQEWCREGCGLTPGSSLSSPYPHFPNWPCQGAIMPGSSHDGCFTTESASLTCFHPRF